MSHAPLSFAVAGAPVLHSQSPALHQAAFTALGLPHRYTRIRAEGPVALTRVLHGVPLVGVNLTAPLKERCLCLADELEPEARLAGALNTLWRAPDGRLLGANTDVSGVRALLGDAPLGPAVVLGAGGAARAAVVALKMAGLSPTVMNRTPARAAALAADLGCAVADWGALPQRLPSAALVISALSSEASLSVNPAWLKPGALVLDADYGRGLFGAKALAHGCQVRTGLDWLRAQAVGAAARLYGGTVSPEVFAQATPPPPPRRLALVGFMGAGKSTVGQEVARALGWSFLDTDSLAEARLGKPIARVFAEDGEPAFRAAEAQVLDLCLGQEQVVIATGGGLPAFGHHAHRLQAEAVTVWLFVSLKTALARTEGDGLRPLRRASAQTLEALFAARSPAYLQASQLIVDAEEDASRVALGMIDEAHRAFAG